MRTILGGLGVAMAMGKLLTAADDARAAGQERAIQEAIAKGHDEATVRARVAAMNRGEPLPPMPPPETRQYPYTPIDDAGIARVNAARAKRAARMKKRGEAYDKGEAGKVRAGD